MSVNAIAENLLALAEDMRERACAEGDSAAILASHAIVATVRELLARDAVDAIRGLGGTSDAVVQTRARATPPPQPAARAPTFQRFFRQGVFPDGSKTNR
jgi:uncharacterized protein (UPF0261 family)